MASFFKPQPVNKGNGKPAYAFGAFTGTRTRLGGCAVLVSTLAFASRAVAQEVLAPPPLEFIQKQTVALPSGTNGLGGIVNGPAMGALPASPSWLDWGPVHARPHLIYRLTHGDGIQSQPGQASKTTIQEVSPGVLFDLGTHWKLDYTPTMRFYSSTNFRDSTDHSVALNGGATYQDWTFGLSQSYSKSSSELVQTGSQTDQESYSTSLSVANQINSKMSVDAAVSQNLRFVGQSAPGQQLSDSKTWSTTEGLNYAFLPRFSLGLSAGFTYDDVGVGSDMTSEQFNGRLNWQSGNKLSLSFSSGFEVRQYLNSSQPTSLDPIFNLSLAYQLFEATSISLSASRSVSASYFQNQTTENTGFNASIRQRLLGLLHLDVGGGYSTSSYGTTTAGLAVNRQDDHVSANARLTCPFLKRGTVSVFYDWSKNISNQTGFGYSSSQAGLELGYRF